MMNLRKMNDQEYSDYLKVALPIFAEEKMAGEGLSSEEALKFATDAYARLLPQGIQTENQFLYSVVDSAMGEVIGVLWIARKTDRANPYAFIYDIVLSEKVRGQGLGKQLMSLMEAEVLRLGMKSVGLHVFGHNHRAIRLYENSGFRTTNRMMAKDLK